MHLINNLRKSHIEFEQTKDEESKELLASSRVEDESTQKLISKRRQEDEEYFAQGK